MARCAVSTIVVALFASVITSCAQKPSPPVVTTPPPPPAVEARGSSAVATSVTPLGAFSHVEMTGEHAYGHAIQLFRSGEKLLGLLLVYVGPAEEPPAGELESIQYDAASGALSFRAKLTLGSVVGAGGRQVPSRDLYSFRGTLKESTLSGVLEITDQAHPDVPPRREMLSLKRDLDAVLPESKSVNAWRESIGEILKTRGPKW
ncbi:MAG: hypothetical protein U0527_04045 [Candidatus Eisenbacteria bacterium]